MDTFSVTSRLKTATEYQMMPLPFIKAMDNTTDRSVFFLAKAILGLRTLPNTMVIEHKMKLLGNSTPSNRNLGHSVLSPGVFCRIARLLISFTYIWSYGWCWIR